MDGEVLRWLKTEDLRELGTAAVRHRRRLLDPIAALGDGEQRTVMFDDQVGSTLPARFDP